MKSYRDEIETVARAISALIAHTKWQIGAWIDAARFEPMLTSAPGALDAAYLALAQAGEALDQALEHIARARGRTPAAPAPAAATGRVYVASRNVAATIDLARVEAVHCTAMYDDLHAILITAGGRVYLRLATPEAETLLDELHAAALLQTRQRDALLTSLREPPPATGDADADAEEAVE